MGLLDRFRGPPSPDTFAQLVIKTLGQLGDTRQATYDKENCRLVFSEDGKEIGTLNLQNLYREYCRSEKKDRTAFLRRACVELGKQVDVPEDFEDAKPVLMPSVRSRSFLDVLRLDWEIQGGKRLELAALPLSEHLVVCLVYDLPNTMHFVERETLDRWGVSLYVALETAKQNLEQREFAVGKVADKLFTFVAGDAFDASRMVLLDAIRSFETTGQPVAMPVNRDCLLVAGSQDEEGLSMMAAIAEKECDEPRPVCSIAHVLNGDDWEPWLPACENPLYERFRFLALKCHNSEYDEQKRLFDKLHEKRKQDVFVASFTVVQRETEVLSYSIWTKGVSAWLPKSEFVGLTDVETRQASFVRWERLQAVVGNLMTPLDCYPPRWSVRDFPSAEQIKQMRPEDLS